eukprot:TRINITY_DN1936_c0_g1_i18.p1 TRINITY_DN1936_c0_g1~~TRINITY_DN1936_c0_g1_i18.p1  ORF type:complete len:527 (-),score=79.73 TRINITY_DN1936_c0_g1_i18:391-1971(-)
MADILRHLSRSEFHSAEALLYRLSTQESTKNHDYINTKNAKGRTVLHECAELDLSEMIKLALMAGCNPDLTDTEGMTALSIACLNGHAESVRKLLEGNANMFIKGPGGLCPLHFASMNGHAAVVSILINTYKCPVDILDNFDDHPMHLAASKGHVSVLEVLHYCRSPLDARTKMGNTPLHAAVINQQHSAAYFLMKVGSNAKEKNASGQTPTDIAKVAKDEKMGSILTGTYTSKSYGKQAQQGEYSNNPEIKASGNQEKSSSKELQGDGQGTPSLLVPVSMPIDSSHNAAAGVRNYHENPYSGAPAASLRNSLAMQSETSNISVLETSNVLDFCKHICPPNIMVNCLLRREIDDTSQNPPTYINMYVSRRTRNPKFLMGFRVADKTEKKLMISAKLNFYHSSYPSYLIKAKSAASKSQYTFWDISRPVDNGLTGDDAVYEEFAHVMFVKKHPRMVKVLFPNDSTPFTTKSGVSGSVFCQRLIRMIFLLLKCFLHSICSLYQVWPLHINPRIQNRGNECSLFEQRCH